MFYSKRFRAINNDIKHEVSLLVWQFNAFNSQIYQANTTDNWDDDYDNDDDDDD